MKIKTIIFFIISVLLIAGFVVYPKIKRNNELKKHLELGFAMINKIKYDKAFNSFNRVLQIDGNESKAYYGKGLLYERLGEYGKTNILFSRAIKNDSLNAKYYLSRSVVRFGLDSIEGALKDYNKYLSLGNVKIKPVFSKEVFIKEIEFFSQLRGDFIYFDDLSPKKNDISFGKGLNYIINHDYRNAILEFNTIISNLSPLVRGDREAIFLCHSYKYRGWAKYKLGQYKSAVDDFDDTHHDIHMWHDGYFDFSFYYFEGLSKMKINDFNGAIKDFTKVIELEPKDPTGYLRRGQAKINLGQKNEACLDFKKAVEFGSEEAKDLIKTNCN